MSEIIPGAGPFFFKGNETCILILHGGGGGTCADLKPIAEDLNKKFGFSIDLPLLEGYGTDPTILRHTKIDAWKSQVLEEYIELQKKYENVIVGGHSMGGILTLLLASGKILDGIFTISAPAGIRGILPMFVPLFNIFIKYYPIESDKFKKETDGAWIGYDKIPLNIAYKIKRMIKEMKNSLSSITSPIILFQGRKDIQIKRKSMDYIYDHIVSEIREKIWLENNEHPILYCPDHDKIVLEISKFIEICVNNK